MQRRHTAPEPGRPQFGLAAPQFREIAIDLVPPRGRERPRCPGEPQLEPLDGNEGDVGHETNYGPSIVIAGLDPAIHTTSQQAVSVAWMRGSSPRTFDVVRGAGLAQR